MRLAWVLIPLWLFGCATGPATFTPSGDPLVDMFEAVVFGDVVDRRRPKTLAKWLGPLSIRLEGAVTPDFLQIVSDHAEALADISGLEIGLVGEDQPANVVIAFGNIDELEGSIAPYLSDPGFMVPMMLSSGCLFVFKEDEAQQIYEAKIFVRTGRSLAGTSACLLGDMTKILGVANDANYIFPSIFNGDDTRTELTDADRRLISAMYDPAITPGLTRRQAMALVRPLLSGPSTE